MRSIVGTYAYTRGTRAVIDVQGNVTTNGVPSYNLYTPTNAPYTYTCGDGGTTSVIPLQWITTADPESVVARPGGTTYGSVTPDAVRQIITNSVVEMRWRFRLLALDQRPGSASFNLFLDKCDGTGTYPAGTIINGVNYSGTPFNPVDPNFPFLGPPVDLTPWVESATVTQDSTQPVQKTLALKMLDTADSDTIRTDGSVIGQAVVDYQHNYVQPICMLRAPDGGFLEVPLGLFRFTDPGVDLGGMAATRDCQLSDLTDIVLKNQATSPAVALPGSTATSLTGNALPTVILGSYDSAGDYYQTLGPDNQTPVPCLTTSVFNTNPNTIGGSGVSQKANGFMYLIDAIRCMLTNSPDDPCLPGCGILPQWIGPLFPTSPATPPPADHSNPNQAYWYDPPTAGSYLTFNWNQPSKGSVVGAGAPIMDLVVPPGKNGGITMSEGMSYLDQINQLLFAGGFDPLYVTDNGSTDTTGDNADGSRYGRPVQPQFISRPWPKDMNYAALPATFVYDTTLDSIVDHGVQVRLSTQDMCNVVALTMESSGQDTVYAIAENHNPLSPISLYKDPTTGIANYPFRVVKSERASNVPLDLNGNALAYVQQRALYYLNRGAALYNTVTFSSAVNPFHESMDVLSLNIWQRYLGANHPLNQKGIVGGIAQSNASKTLPINIDDRFLETGWSITIVPDPLTGLSLPADVGATATLTSSASKQGAIMTHTCSRITNITPDASFVTQAGVLKWSTNQ